MMVVDDVRITDGDGLKAQAHGSRKNIEISIARLGSECFSLSPEPVT
jgi:hypothetical protein